MSGLNSADNANYVHLITVDETPYSSLSNGHALDLILDKIARATCATHLIKYEDLGIIQKLFITHYKCEKCGFQPLYKLDLTHVKRARCSNCGNLQPFRNGGKYGKLRKEIA